MPSRHRFSRHRQADPSSPLPPPPTGPRHPPSFRVEDSYRPQKHVVMSGARGSKRARGSSFDHYAPPYPSKRRLIQTSSDNVSELATRTEFDVRYLLFDSILRTNAKVRIVNELELHVVDSSSASSLVCLTSDILSFTVSAYPPAPSYPSAPISSLRIGVLSITNQPSLIADVICHDILTSRAFESRITDIIDVNTSRKSSDELMKAFEIRKKRAVQSVQGAPVVASPSKSTISNRFVSPDSILDAPLTTPAGLRAHTSVRAPISVSRRRQVQTSQVAQAVDGRQDVQNARSATKVSTRRVCPEVVSITKAPITIKTETENVSAVLNIPKTTSHNSAAFTSPRTTVNSRRIDPFSPSRRSPVGSSVLRVNRLSQVPWTAPVRVDVGSGPTYTFWPNKKLIELNSTWFRDKIGALRANSGDFVKMPPLEFQDHEEFGEFYTWLYSNRLVRAQGVTPVKETSYDWNTLFGLWKFGHRFGAKGFCDHVVSVVYDKIQEDGVPSVQEAKNVWIACTEGSGLRRLMIDALAMKRLPPEISNGANTPYASKIVPFMAAVMSAKDDKLEAFEAGRAKPGIEERCSYHEHGLRVGERCGRVIHYADPAE